MLRLLQGCIGIAYGGSALSVQVLPALLTLTAMLYVRSSSASAHS